MRVGRLCSAVHCSVVSMSSPSRAWARGRRRPLWAAAEGYDKRGASGAGPTRVSRAPAGAQCTSLVPAGGREPKPSIPKGLCGWPRPALGAFAGPAQGGEGQPGGLGAAVAVARELDRGDAAETGRAQGGQGAWEVEGALAEEAVLVAAGRGVVELHMEKVGSQGGDLSRDGQVAGRE